MDNLTSLKDAIGIVKEYQDISDEKIFIFGRKLENEVISSFLKKGSSIGYKF